MKVTVFQSTKTNGKVPYSPTRDKKFMFETFDVKDINAVFFYLSSQFFLNIPLTKSTKQPHFRRRENLESYFVQKLEWVTIDIDEIAKMSDREICINWFRKEKFEIILAESRNPLNIKGVIKVDNLTPKEAKASLKEIQEFLPGKVDLSVSHYASYQAPILKNEVLYKGEGKPLRAPKAHIQVQNILPVQVPQSIKDICRANFETKGFVFYPDGKCSHFTEKKSPKGFTWNNVNPFKMMHWNPDRVVDIWSEIIKTKEYREFNKDKAKKDILELMPSEPKTTVNKRFLNSETETVKDFLDTYKILKIQSPMGTAKSTVIDEIITQSTERELRVLLITNRISLADDIATKYKTSCIKHYQHTELDGDDAKYQIGDNLVCQVNSLWKYSLKYFDVVIIDETTSLLFQLLSLEKNTKNIITKLFATRHKKVVLADAFLFEPLVNLFGDSVISINNSYRDTVNLTLYSQVDRWAQEIIQKAQEGTITVSAGSTKLLKSLELIFENKGISFFTVSSETTKNEKELVYKEFQKSTPKWQVIMYSPTITVGISILAESDHHFHLDRGNSMDVVSSIQMIKRNRNAKFIHLLLDERQKFAPTATERIEVNLLDFSEEDEEGDVLGISEVGHKFAQVHKIFNILENRHKVSFLSLLKYQFTSNLKINNEKITPFIAKIGKLVAKKQIQHDLSLFDEYKKMSPEEISDIEYQLFNKTKDDEKLNTFNILMNDETLNLSKTDIEMLVEEEIKTPGIIDCYKNCLIKSIVSSNNGFSYSLKSYELFLARDINLIEYGYTKQKNLYRLNKTLQKIL